MRILHVNSEAGWSGGEHQVFLLVDELAKLGVESELVAPPGSRSLEAAAERGLPAHPCVLRNYLDLAALRRLGRLYRERQPDLVHLHTGKATWLGGWAASRAGLPAITTRRMDRRVKPGLRTRRIYRRFVQRAVAIAPAVADCLAQGGVPRERIEVIWDAVDPAVVGAAGADPEARQALRAELGAEGDEPVLLSMAALVRRKGLDVLLAALGQLREQGCEPLTWIGGEGAERAALEAQARELGLSRVRFLGWRDDGPALLAAADLFCLPSRREGVGVAALEAMAAGKAVAASAVGGLGQAVVDGESGLLVPPEDEAALAASIGRLVAEPELRRQLGAGAVARVEQVFAASLQAKAYLDLYQRVVAEVRGAGAGSGAPA